MNNTYLHQFFGTKSELALVGAMIGILLVLFSPIYPGMLDFLLILNFSFALLILLLTLYTDKPLTFSTFPSLLLIATLFRLSLNIAATRLILADGYAGAVINAIGAHVVGGNYVIGLVVFFILIVVQYVVVTSGSQRVAEVAARFTLDSMPGKQMSIDADLNMGLIDEKEAQKRRKNIEKEANFYGAMDGASKFVKGDAIAGIIIILINIVGGLTVGVAQKGLNWGEALHHYTLLTVGDGIVTQIPALIISTATGIIVTRAASDAEFGAEITRQITKYPKSLVMVIVALCGLMLLPSIPMLPVFLIGLVMASLLYFSRFWNDAIEEDATETTSEKSIADQNLYAEIGVEPIEVMVGSDLAKTINENDNIFMEKIKSFRKQFAYESGFVIPNVKIIEDKAINENQYEIKIYDSAVAKSNVYLDKFMAISTNEDVASIVGEKTKDPTYGLPALWIEEHQRKEAKRLGYTVVDPITVFVTHFAETIRLQSSELLTRSEVEQMIRLLKEKQPTLCEELIPNVLSLSEIQKVLQNLMREKVSIRNIEFILEVLVDFGKKTKSVEDLTEAVRQKLARSICDNLLSKQGELNVLTLEPALEQTLQTNLRTTETSATLLMDPKLTENIINALLGKANNMMNEDMKPVLLCSPSLRRHLKKMTERMLPYLSVLSLSEIPKMINIKSYDIVRVNSGAFNP